MLKNYLRYGTNEEFQRVLAIGGYVPIKYKNCNTKNYTEYFINEDCNIIHVTPNKNKKKTSADVAWTIREYNPNTCKNYKGKHTVNIPYTALLHRVVASTFLGNPPSDTCNRIRFKDGNCDNCRPNNLEWYTHSEAMHRYHVNKSK